MRPHGSADICLQVKAPILQDFIETFTVSANNCLKILISADMKIRVLIVKCVPPNIIALFICNEFVECVPYSKKVACLIPESVGPFCVVSPYKWVSVCDPVIGW